ncbi:MAG: GH3 auxin-responsive promoter family protein [Sphingobacteriales bacterium]|nr:MAG: GH3 auxin-responsive promoter family protein [Sphingobacteriales bacterium]
MEIFGKLIRTGLKIGYRANRMISNVQAPIPVTAQKKVLTRMLTTAKNTQFGQYYSFEKLLRSKQVTDDFRQSVPIFNYELIYKSWWHKYQQGEENVTWPGKINYFALSSGTTAGSSKYIPESYDMLRSFRNTAVRLILNLSEFPIPDSFWGTQIFMLGGSTNLKKVNNFFVGDLSGITASKLPIWFKSYYKPGAQIAQTDDWFSKLDLIAKHAKSWNIGAITGIPSWICLMLKHIIDKHGLRTIHDIWPNLSVLVHGGIAFEPYRKSLEALFGKPVVFIDTYFASEGDIAFQSRPDSRAMRMILDQSIFFEFVPFTDQNFTAGGEVLPDAKSLLIHEVETQKEYALLLSTRSGAWRYLIGDTIKFTDVENCEIVVTGRTKHFISLCGEHLSVDNMNHAIEKIEEEFNVSIPEFAVSGISYENAYAHQWFIGTDATNLKTNIIKHRLDTYLKQLNDDYQTERNAGVLKEIFLEILPTKSFYQWMEKEGKMGGQHKFPRVLRGKSLQSWSDHIGKDSTTI